MKCYSEMIKLPTLKERFEYLSFGGPVGETTFGYDRWLNQVFYKSKEWERVRREVIIRDNGCDLADPDYVIYGRVIIHHMNIITLDDIRERTDYLLDPEYLITTCHNTHNAIHYGDSNLLPLPTIERKPFDTCPWRN